MASTLAPVAVRARHLLAVNLGTACRAQLLKLLKMLKALASGDVVTVTRIDHLARSTFDLFGIVKRIAAVACANPALFRLERLEDI